MLLDLALYIIKFYVFITFKLCNVEIKIPKRTKELIYSGKPLITLLWHDRLLLFPYIFDKRFKRSSTAVISHHKDGEYLTNSSSYIDINQYEVLQVEMG